MTRRSKKSAARRVPTQERSKKRVEAILDAAAVIFAESGFDAVAMKAIARRADTSIGSLYQFFPDKRSLFRALAERCLERSRATFEALLAAGALSGPWTELLDAMLDGFAALHRSDPAFRAVLMNLQLYGLYAESDLALHDHLVGELASALRPLVPGAPRGKRVLISSLVITAVAAMLVLSQRAPPALARGLLAETKRMLRQYLAGYMHAG